MGWNRDNAFKGKRIDIACGVSPRTKVAKEPIF
jgi:hypothetical protein